jgi:hypothetical protein
MHSERFCSVMGPKRMKFSLDSNVDYKKSFKLYCQILLKALTKVGINVAHCSSMKVNKMKPRINVMLKKALFPADYLN